MYGLFKLIENANRFLRIKFKILYWKLKYGKRIKIGKKLRFRKGMIINIAKDGFLEIGDNNGFNNYCSINCHKHIKIGNNNMFGENVKFYDHDHVFNKKDIDMSHTYNTGEINIGNYNWLASNVIVLRKTNIKDYNVIGANIVLNEELDSNILMKSVQECKKEEIIKKN